ncbi:MAG: CHAT domain-containing protein [Telmatospirillum sp.]|nr:CHAT domain-containing protein [Telmatospirillum sp.]
MKSIVRAGLALGLVLLAACDPDGKPAVSLQQARQIAAEFQGQSFQPPPRTISDIAAILDQQKPDPAKVAAALAKADAQPAPALQGAELAAFLYERALASGELGRIQQRLADLRQANELARAANVGGQIQQRYLQQLAQAEAASGNVGTAIKMTETRVAEATNPVQRFNATSGLVGWSVNRGDLARATAELKKMEDLLVEIRQNSRMPQQTLWDVQSGVARARGLVAMESGRYAEAEAHLRAALAENARLVANERSVTAQWSAPSGALTERGLFFSQNLANAIMRQGRYVEAEVEIRRVLLARLQRQGRYAVETLQTVQLLADNLMEQGRIAEAERLAHAVYDSYETMQLDPSFNGYVRAMGLVARAQMLHGDASAALRTFADLRKRLGNNRQAVARVFDANLTWGMASLVGGNAPEAERVFANIATRRLASLGERNWDTAMARALLGAAKSARGDVPGALAEFDAAAPILLQSSRQSDDEEQGSAGRDAQLRLAFEGMMSALAASNRPGAAEEAFRIADAVRGQGVQRALAQSSARAAASDPALTEFVRQEQDTQKQVGALQGLLTNILSAPERDETAVRALRVQIDNLRAARAAIRQEIERRFPDYANLIDPRPATVEQTRRALRGGEALIATYVGQSQSFVWAVPQTGPVAFAGVPLGRQAIGDTVATLRKALDPNAAALGDIPAFDVALAGKLYDALLKPVEAGFANAASLLVVPHDTLGQLPFGVLVTNQVQLAAERDGEALFSAYKPVPFLIRKAAITQLPSVASLATLRSLPPAPANRRAFIGFGDPWFSAEQMVEAKTEAAAAAQTASLATRGAANRLQTRGLPLVRRSAPATTGIDSAELANLPRLPDTADEVRGIALALNAAPSDLYLGAAANERNVKTVDLSNRRVVMFATHGLIPGDLNGLLQPALALSAPNVADIDGDGLLTLDEVLGLKLNADWVVLSACNTATGDGAGAEAVSGLGRAFFYAGTRALLVSNWPVETTSARTLTTDLFARQARDANLARASALQQAMLGLLDGPGFVDPASRQTVFAYSHPIFWAPFSLVGDGGGSGRSVAQAE